MGDLSLTWSTEGPCAFLEVSRTGVILLRRALPSERPVVIGRGESADWRVDGEPYLSRRHVEATLTAGGLTVRRLPEASNLVMQGGVPRDEFVMADGDRFVIGKTIFRLVFERRETAAPADAKAPDYRYTLDPADLYAPGGSSAAFRLRDLLELPELLRGRNRAGFYAHVAGMLRLATGGAWSCVLTREGGVLGEDCADDVSRFSASRALVRKAFVDAPQPTLYCWRDGDAGMNATAADGVDWAICAAARVPGESDVAFYVAGRGQAEEDARGAYQDAARFVGLVADIVGRSVSLDREKRLERYFAGPVAKKILLSANPDDLEPRQALGTVMFFDIRGFSRRSEGNLDRMAGHLREIKKVMTAMTGIILDEHGVVLSYIGDAIYACWNLPFEDDAHVDRAVRAALAMKRELSRITDDWRCGIGIHCGQVVAGAMGSEQIFSYGVMGPVVNQASRIEGITKQVGVPILVSREVAGRLSAGVAIPVRIGRFQPAGMDTPLDLFDLEPPPGDAARRAAFADGLAAFESGDWTTAGAIFRAFPADDMAARFLHSLAAEHSARAPRDWRGVIKLTQK